jgi:hypothetical protein
MRVGDQRLHVMNAAFIRLLQAAQKAGALKRWAFRAGLGLGAIMAFALRMKAPSGRRRPIPR